MNKYEADPLLFSHLVDIFAMVPQNLPPPTSTTDFSADTRLLRYQDVLAKMSASTASSTANQQASDAMPNVSDGWASDDDEDEVKDSFTPVKSKGVGPLLGGFADAETVTD